MASVPLDDQGRVLVDVVERLERAGLDYMISGSVALSAYVRPRMTRDVDVVVVVDRNRAAALTAAFAGGYYLDAAAVERAVADRRLVNAVHDETLVKVDLIVRKDEPFRRLEFERRRELSIGGRRMWVVSPEDLLLSKLVWAASSASAVQRADAVALVGLELDWAYLDRWAAELGVLAALGELRA